MKIEKRRQNEDKHLNFHLHSTLCLPKGVHKILKDWQLATDFCYMLHLGNYACFFSEDFFQKYFFQLRKFTGIQSQCQIV